MVPAGLFVGFSLLIFWLANKPSVADFMVAAEGEMKKVSWSSRKEIAVSTFIVIMVVILMAVLLGITDLVFQVFFGWLLRSEFSV
jgi:preprotein translocase SecE subunit